MSITLDFSEILLPADLIFDFRVLILSPMKNVSPWRCPTVLEKSIDIQLCLDMSHETLNHLECQVFL